MKRNPTGQQSGCTVSAGSESSLGRTLQKEVNINMNFTHVQVEGIRCLETQSLGRKRKPLQGVAASGSGVAPRRRREGDGRFQPSVGRNARPPTVSLRGACASLLAPWLCPLLAGLAWQAPRFLTSPASGGLRASLHGAASDGPGKGSLEGCGIRLGHPGTPGQAPGVRPHAHPRATQHRFRGQDVTSVRALTLPATRPE